MFTSINEWKLYKENNQLFDGLLTQSKLTQILSGLRTNDEFLYWGGARNDGKDRKLHVTDSYPFSLISGYCDAVAVFIKLHYMDDQRLKVWQASDYTDRGFEHIFLKFEDKCYDAVDVNGVPEPKDMFFFKNCNKDKLIDSQWEDLAYETLDKQEYLK
jgi:hypothetical protein